MIKGCQREMIVMQTQDSAVFESAYFVLRKERRGAAKTDLLVEANRIIGAGGGEEAKRRRLPRGFLPFLLGMVAGIALFALFALLFRAIGY